MKRVILGTGYFDTANCRRLCLLWREPLDSDDAEFVRIGRINSSVMGKKIRLIAEILPERAPRKSWRAGEKAR